MVEIPKTPAFKANRDKARKRGEGGREFCVCCGMVIRNPDAARLIHEHNGGGVAVTAAEAATLNPAADMGGQTVGSECWRRFPQLHPYEMKR